MRAEDAVTVAIFVGLPAILGVVFIGLSQVAWLVDDMRKTLNRILMQSNKEKGAAGPAVIVKERPLASMMGMLAMIAGVVLLVMSAGLCLMIFTGGAPAPRPTVSESAPLRARVSCDKCAGSGEFANRVCTRCGGLGTIPLK